MSERTILYTRFNKTRKYINFKYFELCSQLNANENGYVIIPFYQLYCNSLKNVCVISYLFHQLLLEISNKRYNVTIRIHLNCHFQITFSSFKTCFYNPCGFCISFRPTKKTKLKVNKETFTIIAAATFYISVGKMLMCISGKSLLPHPFVQNEAFMK